jgi:hypothetical protein
VRSFIIRTVSNIRLGDQTNGDEVAGLLARMRVERNIYTILVGKLQRKTICGTKAQMEGSSEMNRYEIKRQTV